MHFASEVYYQLVKLLLSGYIWPQTTSNTRREAEALNAEFGGLLPAGCRPVQTGGMASQLPGAHSRQRLWGTWRCSEAILHLQRSCHTRFTQRPETFPPKNLQAGRQIDPPRALLPGTRCQGRSEALAELSPAKGTRTQTDMMPFCPNVLVHGVFN